ncbi:MAG: hypothetical protein ABR577_13925 [Pyrinomonadaceae bacterium]
MKRAQDKIKDFVEPQHFDEVQKYADDPARALAAYRFTDATSDLLARWLDALANLPRGRGASRALAGPRGVGKSHALAAFGALAALPELRSSVADVHVATSARRLLNRRYVVARVERGLRPTLTEEIGVALAAAFGGDESVWQSDPSKMLAMAAAQASDATLVLIIDTAFGREARVVRDDGALLSQLATATEHVGAFIALALDDDIEGADGANVALAGAFQIDYLDPEHLYRVADLHLFRKNLEARAGLHGVYATLRAVVPGFNWSEPRFAAIYPVHPLVAEIAAAVRLYAPTFAFLPFAAASVARATNRPALSLIVLDEVFDRVEYDLRKAEELQGIFKAYDELAATTIAQFPIMQRLQAKLILKGLFILSMDGRGATARELGAAMLIYDEATPNVGIERIEAMLVRFADTAPQGALQKSEDAGETRYRFVINASAGFDAALAEAAARLASENPAAINELLRTIAAARFSDWPFAESLAPPPHNEAPTEAANDPATAELLITWRGTGRRIRLGWRSTNADAETVSDAAPPPRTDTYEWDITLLAPGVANTSPPDAEKLLGAASPFAFWRPAQLSVEETNTLHRLIALRVEDASLVAGFGDVARVAERTHAALAERIWARLYLDEGVLVTGGATLSWTDKARSAQTLAGALASVLAPLLGARYPQHPIFTETLTEIEVARLVGGLFGGANQTDAGVQELARSFAAPLGLASSRNDLYTLEASDQALGKAWVRDVLQLTDDAAGAVVSLDAINEKLGPTPYGLGREAQRLVLAALVAGRRIELVTKNKDRVGRRTLDHALKWDDIEGIARAATLLHNAEELAAWARLLTNDATLVSINDPASRESVRASLTRWLNDWRKLDLLRAFDNLPDEGLTTRAWNLAAAVRKSFGVAAESVEAALADSLPLEESLQRVADAFGDAPETYTRLSQQLTELESFVSGLGAREKARAYLASAEPTGASEIESAHRELQTMAADAHSLFDAEARDRFDQLWREFHVRYVELYASAHDRTVGASFDRRGVDAILRSNEWREFEALSQLSFLNRSFADEAARLRERLKNTPCELPVRLMLQDQAACSCSFRLTRAVEIQQLADSLAGVVKRGLNAHRRTLARWSTHLAHALQEHAQDATDEGARQRSLSLSTSFAEGRVPVALSVFDIELIESVLQRTGAPPLRVALPADGYGLLTRDELDVRLRQWLEELPEHPALIEVVGERSEHDGDAG